MSFNQLAPTVPTVLNTSNCLVFGNTVNGTALSVQQLGTGNVATFRTTTGSTALFVAGSGNVGVGTTNPTSRLHVQGGDIYTTSNINGNAGNTTWRLQPQYVNSNPFPSHFRITNGWDPILGTGQANYGAVGINLNSYQGGSALEFYTSATNNAVPTQRMVITQDGRVGIGTDTPGYTLDIGTPASSTYTLRLQAASTTAGTMGTSIRMIESVNDSYGFSFQNLSGSRLGIFRHSASAAGTEVISVMRDTQRVGIGTTNPNWTLSTQYAGGNDSSTTPALNFAAEICNITVSGGNNRTNLLLFTDGNSTQGAMGAFRRTFDADFTGGLVFYIANQPSGYTASRPTTTAQASGSLTEAMRIDYTGRVGIGTKIPTNLLSLYATGLAFQASSGGIILQRSDVATSWTIAGPDGGNTLRIVNAGAVGVQLVNGTTAWAAASDSRLKNIIEPISNAISKTNQLSTVIYSWKTDETNAPHPGLIAQEVQEVQPEAVSEGVDGMLSVRYTELIPLALAAIKELSTENNALKQSLASMESRLAALEARG